MPAFDGHEVVLPRRPDLAWRLQDFAGRNGATLIIGAILVVFFGWALLTQPGQARAFVVAALITGFLAAAFGATLKPGVTTSPVTENFESGSRYTALPIFLIEAAAVVAVSSFICHGQHRLRAVAAVAALVGVLSVGWVTDFRYQGWRGSTVNWPPTAAAWLHACQRTPDGVLREPTGASFNGAKTAIPCASLRRLCRAARSVALAGLVALAESGLLTLQVAGVAGGRLPGPGGPSTHHLAVAAFRATASHDHGATGRYRSGARPRGTYRRLADATTWLKQNRAAATRRLSCSLPPPPLCLALRHHRQTRRPDRKHLEPVPPPMTTYGHHQAGFRSELTTVD